MYVCDLRFSTTHNQARFDLECVISCTVRSLRKKHEHSREGDVSRPGCVHGHRQSFWLHTKFWLVFNQIEYSKSPFCSQQCQGCALHEHTFFQIPPLMESLILKKSYCAVHRIKKKKKRKKISLLGKMSLTLVHGRGNGGWHIQYRETVRAKYLCQPDSFTVKRWGWRVHLGLDLNAACCGLQVLASFFFFL